MPYKIHYQGVEVSCDSLADLDRLVRHVKDPNAKQKLEEAADFFRRMPKPSRTLLQELVGATEEGKALTDADLRRRLNLGDNKKLAGVLAGCSKRIKTGGMNPEDVIDKVVTRDEEGDRVYHYSIKPDALPIVAQGLSKGS